MAIRVKNLFYAWISTLLGGLIMLTSNLVTWLVEGEFNWKVFTVTAVIAVIMAFTDLFKELKKQIDNDKERIDGLAIDACLGIQDTTTSLFLIGWNKFTNTPTWGSEQDALCLTPEQQAEILAILNAGGGNNFIGVRPRKGS